MMLACVARLSHRAAPLGSRAFSSENSIKLLVCDMAGTTVDEGGIIYVALREAMNAHGLKVQEHEMDPWHGAQKSAVMEWFLKDRGMTGRVSLDDVEDSFVSALEDAYFSPDAQISLISNKLPFYFEQLRMNDIQVALNTGYPQQIQNKILEKLGMKPMVDAYTCAYDVKAGRPSPYMVYKLMEQTGIMSVKQVAKAGDTVADIGEGRNAGCGLVVGVLSGADSALQLKDADIVVGDITDVPLECYAAGGDTTRAILKMANQNNLWLPEATSSATSEPSVSVHSPSTSGESEFIHSAGGHSISIKIAEMA
jgi:phosphonatase-like hydrolase